MTLLERAQPLAALVASASQAREGDGQFVLITGEAGVGKSALVEALAHELADARWLWGACDGLFTPRPLAPLFDIAEQVGGELQEVCSVSGDRELLFRTLLRELSGPSTLTVVVVEDIHWADEATLDLLRFLSRRIRNAAVLLVATYRDEGLAAAEPLRRGLGELVTQGQSSRIELAALSLESVRELSEPSGLPAQELYELTAGNPFYVTEVLRTGTGAIPSTTRDVILARAARLLGPAREALDAAALIGSRIEFELLIAVAGVPAAIIDELLACGLLASEGTRLRFRHEIARLAVEQAVPAHRRGATHGRILAALRASGCEDDARLAFHAEGAADGPAVLLLAPRAAERAVALASHNEAVAQYQRTLRFAANLDSLALATLYDRLANELSVVDRWQEAADAGERALELWRAVGDRLREGDTLRRLSRAMWRLCRGREANTFAESALAILEPLGPSAELAWAYANVATNRMTNNGHAEAVAVARKAQAIAEQIGAFDVQSDALNTEGCALSVGSGWREPLEKALEIAIANRFEEQAGRAFANLYEVSCAHLEFAAAHRYFAEGIAYSDEHEMGTYATCLRGRRSLVLVQTGQWDEAEKLSLEVLGDCGPSSISRISPIHCLAIVRARRGQPAAVDLLDDLMRAANGTEEASHIVSTRLLRAEVYWLQGNTDMAKREVELAEDVCAECDDWERGDIAVWLRRVNSTRAARGSLAEPYRSQVAGDWRQAADEWARLGCSYAAAMALLDAAEEGPLREALRIFEELGAVTAARITRAQMRAIGVRSIPVGRRASTRAHPLGLTHRERDVLELICDGCTNAEIAAELVISPRTVDHHVSAILAKLGAPTRDVAATQAAQLGLVAAG